MLDDIIRTLPEDLMKELNGGIHAVERDKLHKKAKNMDLWILGEYLNSRQMGRSIIIYYGSFMRLYGGRNEAFIRERLRKNVLHEFRHHLESLAGERGLEIEDEIAIKSYEEKNRNK